MVVINELGGDQQSIVLIRREGFVMKSYQHHLCVPTSHLSNLLDTWLRSIAMSYEICQPPCLLTGCADSLAACLFVYSLSRSKQMPPLLLCLLALSPSHWIGVCALAQSLMCWPFPTIYCCKVMSKHAVLRYRAYCLKKWSVISGGGLTWLFLKANSSCGYYTIRYLAKHDTLTLTCNTVHLQIVQGFY